MRALNMRRRGDSHADESAPCTLRWTRKHANAISRITGYRDNREVGRRDTAAKKRRARRPARGRGAGRAIAPRSFVAGIPGTASADGLIDRSPTPRAVDADGRHPRTALCSRARRRRHGPAYLSRPATTAPRHGVPHRRPGGDFSSEHSKSFTTEKSSPDRSSGRAK
ncbi:hypothetical protein EVAR_97279_1 [Eumeta japonica]|uniref:Uncharacterized protein n=1 Tax=Eumeta variegata TaxID=151549 RepID=A0A4C1XHZ2_EUMVA|nr:hypothetical protein EVAR_97279_1 [Eumeta japonica]